MKVYISADIEGVGGVVRGDQSSPEGSDYGLARRLMTGEVNAAAAGAFQAGAKQVTVADAHNNGINLLTEELDPRVMVASGSPRPLRMMAGLGDDYDAVFLVGYHAMAGTELGVLAHTFVRRIAELRINGQTIGETGLNAGLAGYYGLPVVMISGDDRVCAEATALLGDVETATVKQGLSAYGAISHHPKKCRELINQAAQRALRRLGDFKPCLLGAGPTVLEVDFINAAAVDYILDIPGVERTAGKTVRFEGKDYLEAFRAFVVMAGLSNLTAYI